MGHQHLPRSGYIIVAIKHTNKCQFPVGDL